MAEPARPNEPNQPHQWIDAVASQRESIDNELQSLNAAVDDIAKRMEQFVNDRRGRKVPAITRSKAQVEFTQLVNKVHEEKRKVAQEIRRIGPITSENVLSKEHILLYERINGIEKKESELNKRGSPLKLSAEVKAKSAVRALAKRFFTPAKGARQEEIDQFKTHSEKVLLWLSKEYTKDLSLPENKAGLKDLLQKVSGSKMRQVSSDEFREKFDPIARMGSKKAAPVSEDGGGGGGGSKEAAPVSEGGGGGGSKEVEGSDSDDEQGVGGPGPIREFLDALNVNNEGISVVSDELISFIKGYPESVSHAMTTSPASRIIKETWDAMETIKNILPNNNTRESGELQELSNIEFYEAMLMPDSREKFLLSFEAVSLLDNLAYKQEMGIYALSLEVQKDESVIKMYEEDRNSHMYTYSQIATQINKIEKVINIWLGLHRYFLEEQNTQKRNFL